MEGKSARRRGVVCRPFADARAFVHTLGLKSRAEWGAYARSGDRPDDIPRSPGAVYKAEWQGMGDWLGTGTIANQNREYRTTYEKAVRDHLTRRRQAVPIVPRAALSPLAERQTRILGGDLIQWNNNIANSLLSERALLGKLENWHKDPVIFFISTMPGLVASQEIIGDEHRPFVWGLPEDFDSFEERDEEFIVHVEYRSLFKEPESDADVKELTKSHPLEPGESYFIHTVESVMGPLFARGGEHLWKWDGEKLELLEEAWRTWVS